MNRRDMLKSGALFTGGLAIAGMPTKSYGILPIIPPPPKPFNPNILNAYHTTSQTAIAAFNGNGATSTQFTAMATAHAIYVDELNSTGNTATAQYDLTSMTNAIETFDPATANISALVASANTVAPVTYAQMQYAVQQITSGAASALLASNSLTTAFANYQSALQDLAAYAAQNGGTLRISDVRGRSRIPHFQNVHLAVITAILWGGAFAIAAVLCPPIAIGTVLGVEVTMAGGFAAAGAIMGAEAGIAAYEGD